MADEDKKIKPLRRLMFAGDKTIGIMIATILPEGSRTTLIERETIEAYADANGQTFDQIFGDIAGALAFVAGMSDILDPVNSGSAVAVAEEGAKAKFVEEIVEEGKQVSLADFCFFVEPDENDFDIGRMSVDIDVIATAIAKSGASNLSSTHPPGEVIRGLLGR